MKIVSRSKNVTSDKDNDSRASVNGGEGESQVPALQRGLAILEMLATSPDGATLSEVSSALKFSPASAFRITGVLEETGYVKRDEVTRRFTLTRKLLLLSQPRQDGRSLAESCLPAMREVLRLTGETVQLCCLADEQCVMIEQLPSTFPFKYIVDIGSRPPIYCCAPGKAIMAYLSADEQHQILSRLNLEAHTSRTMTTFEELQADFAKVRVKGFAVDQGEHFEGIHCVAAPLLNRHGYPIAALTMAGPSSRIPSRRFTELGQIMKQAAKDASLRYLG